MRQVVKIAPKSATFSKIHHVQSISGESSLAESTNALENGMHCSSNFFFVFTFFLPMPVIHHPRNDVRK